LMSMGTVEDRLAFGADLPLLLTVEEAAGVLRIGRTLAYALARRYGTSGGVAGLPVIRLGNCLRVPRWALLELARGGRVVSLAELVADTAELLSRFDDEPQARSNEELDQPPDLEPRPASKPSRSRRSARRSASAVHRGQQLVLLPSE
jgi:hypothetical protein